jgi:hypothetical protein
MALISQRTNLKSLRYGQDRPGGGDSGQPYIQSSISGKLLDINIANLNVSIPFPNLGILGRGTGGEDFLLRGGTLTPSRAFKDVSRLTKMFLDVKSSKGALFTIKQNVLSRVGVKSQASGLLNEGIYTPASTLLQAAGNAFGAHFNKQGLNPFRNTSPDITAVRGPLNLPVYTQTVKSTQKWEDNRLVQLQLTKLPSTLPPPTLFNNVTPTTGRLARQARRAQRRSSPSASFARLTTPQNQISRNDQEILKYGGGPGSFLGVGTTTLRRYTDTQQGIKDSTLNYNPRYYGLTPFYTLSSTTSQTSSLSPITDSINDGIIFAFPSSGVLLNDNIHKYTNTREGLVRAAAFPKESKSFYGKTFFPNITPTQTTQKAVDVLGSEVRNNGFRLYTDTNSGLDFYKAGNEIFQGKYYVLDSLTIFNQSSSRDNTQISDFRTEIPPTQVFPWGKKNILSKAPDYQDKNIENRVNLGDPGRRDKNVSSYTKGLTDILGTRYGALDKITAMPLYQSGIADHGGDRNDLVKFSIGIIDNNNPENRTFIHFRAFLDSMEDNYNAEWNNFKYMGRGENFYRYNGFTRTINLGWTVAAQSKEELIPMYQKLNFLASSLAPDFSDNGYMRGNLAIITVGGYLFDQPGIINSINYSVPTESPWEIGINDEKDNPVTGTKYGYDTSVKELPHIIKVTGFSFTPIHKFVPKLQKNTYEGVYNKDNSGLDKVISKWDQEGGRYIALATGVSGSNVNNYDSTVNKFGYQENYTY